MLAACIPWMFSRLARRSSELNSFISRLLRRVVAAAHRLSDAAKDKVPRSRVDEIEDQCALTVGVHVGIGDRSAVPHAVTAVTVRPAAVIAVAPVGILLHRNFLMNKDLTNNIEI